MPLLAIVILGVGGYKGIHTLSHSKEVYNPLLKQNIEALTSNETAGGVWIQCDGSTMALHCAVVCRNCGRVYKAIGGYGTAIGAGGTCACKSH